MWDCDERSYRYYIEASSNGRDWEVIVDKTREDCKSWQYCTFNAREIVYFKIVGTFNTANEVNISLFLIYSIFCILLKIIFFIQILVSLSCYKNSCINIDAFSTQKSLFIFLLQGSKSINNKFISNKKTTKRKIN